MSTVETQPSPATRLNLGYDKNLMLFTGRANPQLASRIAGKLGIDPGPLTLKTFTNGEVYCKYGESIRGADVSSSSRRARIPSPACHRTTRSWSS